MPDLEPMPFVTFQEHLARITHLDPDCLTLETNLVVDLGLDSLKILEILLEFEKLGILGNLKEAWGIQTVGEAYEYYQHAAATHQKDQE